MNKKYNEKPDILIKFLKYLSNVKHYSIKTINGYGDDLITFFRFIKKYLNLPIKVSEFNLFIVRDIKEGDILAFLIYLDSTKLNSASTRKRKLASIKAFYKWLYDIYPIDNISNPAKNLPSIQEVFRLPKYLNLNEAEKILNIFNRRNSKFPERNNLIIAFFLNCGLRVSELANIRICDLNLEEGYVRIIGKGNKERKAWLNRKNKEKLEKYLIIRNKDIAVIDITNPLFVSYQRKQKLSVRAIETIVENAYKLAKIGDRGYTTHTLRHTSATIMYQYVKPDILLLKEFLGHSTVKSTEIYTHITNENIKKAFNSNPLSNFEPRNIA